MNETLDTVIPEAAPAKKPRWGIFIMAIFILFLIAAATGIAVLSYLNRAPQDTTFPAIVTVEPGMSVRSITDTLEASGMVRSSTMLYLAITLFYEPRDIKASTYVFDKPLTTFEVAKRLAVGDFDSNLLRFTHYEGERATEIATHAKNTLTNFDEAAFLERAIPLEGKLYPETYFIPKDYTADQLIDLMLTSFNKETADLQPLMEAHTLTPDEILVLASILEREANSTTSMKIVSGILQRRLAEGMPLQADASIEYVLDKPLKELTPEDLKVDSPYNTYLNRGLPPTPIGNPGRTAIEAVLEPTDTDYVYYITDNSGEFHYARTYDEHLDNIEMYLR
ncbi:MAG TPA: endolytic transglycosylase MltG [Candidatus Paceibacterota bacterium]